MKSKLSLLLFLFCTGLVAQSNRLSMEINRLKEDKDIANGIWSIYAINTSNDSVIANYNGEKGLTPASTLKAITTATALSMYGKMFQFKTSLQIDGTINTNTKTLEGNLYIRGGGDPSLGSNYFKEEKDTNTITDKWAGLIKELGIENITGSIIADASIFENHGVPDQWTWGDMGNYYGAGANGLSFADNKYAIHFKTGLNGSKSKISRIEPEIPGLKIQNEVIAQGYSDNAYIYGAPFEYNRVIRGTIPPKRSDFVIYGSMPEPGLICAHELKKSMENIGIQCKGEATTVRLLTLENKAPKTARQEIYNNSSPNLEEIIYWTNLKSVNLFAEHLLKFFGYKSIGVGSNKMGLKFMENYWRMKGINVEGLHLSDGSGLARSNSITTRTEAEILNYMTKNKDFEAYFNSLPVAGKSGSLASMCKGTKAQNNLRAKSGYINRVRAYTGYVKNSKGELICFSMIANNYSCTAKAMKKKLERLMVALAE